jgi:ABC-2 type transport system ATP-binding protein
VSTTATPAGLPIEVRGLTKTFGKVQAVQQLDFTVQPGRVTGFLGPNGAGKTTTLRMLLSLVKPTAGTATIGGRRYRDIPLPLHEVGAVLEATSFHPARRARSHLQMIAISSGVDLARVDEVLGLVGLSGDAKRRVGGFSMGMRQRLELAGALLGDPGVLILDEPSNGLDPQGIVWLREFLRYLAGQGRTVLVSSHLLAEMSQTVDDVVIVAQGQLRAQGSLASLMSGARPGMRIRTPEADRLQAVLSGSGLHSQREAFDIVSVAGATPEQLGPLLAHYQVVIYELTTQGFNLEALFLSLTSGLGYEAAVPGAAVQPVPTSPIVAFPHEAATGWAPSTAPPVSRPRHAAPEPPDADAGAPPASSVPPPPVNLPPPTPPPPPAVPPPAPGSPR